MDERLCVPIVAELLRPFTLVYLFIQKKRTVKNVQFILVTLLKVVVYVFKNGFPNVLQVMIM